MSEYKDSVWLLKARRPEGGDWTVVRSYALMSDLAADESMLRKILPDWEFDMVEVEYVG